MEPKKEPGKTVLFVTNDTQIDRRVLQQADTLEAHGWIVFILALPQAAPASFEEPRVVRIRMDVKEREMRRFSLASAYQRFHRFLPISGGTMLSFLKRVTWGRFKNPESFYLDLYADYLGIYKPEIVVGVGLPMLPVAREIATRSGAKLIYDSHKLFSEQSLTKHEKKIWSSIEARHISQCKAVVAVNASIAGELKRRYQLTDVKVLSNAAPKLEPRQKSSLFHSAFSLWPERRVLLFQGQLVRDRHLEALVKAFRYVKNPFIDLVFLGGGPLKANLERLVRSLGLRKRVYFHPQVAQKELLNYTQAADAGIIPYQATCLNNYYATPNKLFEFIAAGLPILASSLPEINNIVIAHDLGLTGTMVTPYELALLIDELFQDEGRFSRWKENILRVQDKFSWTCEEKKWLELVESL